MHGAEGGEGEREDVGSVGQWGSKGRALAFLFSEVGNHQGRE